MMKKIIALLLSSIMVLTACYKENIPMPDACFKIMQTNDQFILEEINTSEVEESVEFYPCEVNIALGEGNEFYTIFTGDSLEDVSHIYGEEGAIGISFKKTSSTAYEYMKPGTYKVVLVATNTAEYGEVIMTDTTSRILHITEKAE